MSNLQMPNSPEQNMIQTLISPCEWCGGAAGHYGWCDSVKLDMLHKKIDHLTEQIYLVRHEIEACGNMLAALNL